MASKYAANTDHAFLKLDSTVLGIYNAWDTYNTARLVDPLIRESKSHGPAHWKFYEDTIEPLQYAVLNMQRRGMLLDRDALNSYRRAVRNERDEVDDLIKHTAGNPEFNPNSDHQVRKLLFNEWNLKPAGRTDSGVPSVNLENLTRVLRDLRVKDEPYREPLLNLFHRSRLQTIYERYLGLSPDEDGRVRAKVKMTGTKTWRFAYEEPALQQFPPEARHVFVAAPGHRLVGVDYSQLEARILAALSNDETSLEVFRSGGDVHSANARDLFRYTQTQWETLGGIKTKASRNWAKTFLYGLCLDEETPVATLGPEGSKPIRDVKVGEWVWTWGSNGYEKAQVTHHWYRGEKPCVTVVMCDRTGKLKRVTCTKDHRFLMRDGSYKEAQDLQFNDSLMPFRRFNSKGYRQLDSLNNGGRVFEHRLVCPGVRQVHHQNRIKSDNRPENLLVADSDAEHKRHHIGDKRNLSDEQRREWGERARQTIQKNHHKLAEGRRRSEKWLEAVKARSVPAMQAACHTEVAKARRRETYRQKRLENHRVVAVLPEAGLRRVYDISIGPNQNFAIDGAVFVHNSYGGSADTMKTKTFCPCFRCVDKTPQTLELTRPQIKVAAEAWFQRHPAVRRFQRELAEWVQRHHYYDSPFGLRRWFSKPWGSDLDRELKNVPEQMNGALLMNRSQVALDRQSQPIVLQMHDQFMFEVPTAQVNDTISIARTVMESVVLELGGLSYPVDVAVGRNWGDYSEANPSGLKQVDRGVVWQPTP